MLTLQGAGLIFADTDDGGLTLTVDHGGQPQRIVLGPGDRLQLVHWLAGDDGIAGLTVDTLDLAGANSMVVLRGEAGAVRGLTERLLSTAYAKTVVSP